MRPEPRELPELVRDLHRRGVAWEPVGLGTRRHWGPPVRPPCVPLSCTRLQRILEHNPGDFTISVEAGTPLVVVQEALAHHRQWLALDLPWGSGDPQGSPESAGSIGGLVARGLAGGYRERYLGIRDQLIGIELLRADGVAARAGGKVVKNVAGYDLMRLFTGSWGSLGLITALTLRTLPLPPERRGLLVQGPLGSLAELARWLRQSSLSPERVDWWNGPLAAAAGLPPEPLLLIGLASVNRATLDEQIACLREQTPLPARSLDADELEALLRLARRGPTAGAEPATTPAPQWLLRLGVAPDRADRLLATPELADLAVDLAAGSGLGMAWGTSEANATAAGCRRVETLRHLCTQLGGHLTVLIQPGGGTLEPWGNAPARPLIEAVKRRFDPSLQLSPGRLPGVRPADAPGPSGTAGASGPTQAPAAAQAGSGAKVSTS